MINFVLCQVRLILFNTNLITKINILFVKTVLKKLSITTNFVKLHYEGKKKKNWLASLIFFHSGTLSRIPLRPVLISI